MSRTPPDAAAAGPPPSPFAGLGEAADRTVVRGVGQVVRRALGPYQTAVVRIGFAFTWLAFLVWEFPHRHELYGPGSPWGWDLADRLLAETGAFTALMWSDGTFWFECVYLLAMASSVALLLGWRTRTASVFFMLGVLSLQNRSVFVGDGGDNVIHLMAIYLVLTRCGQVWSLDARRRARGGGRASDPVGLVLWTLSGLALAVVTVNGQLGGWVWLVSLWGLWSVHALWWVLSREAPGEPRVVADVIANLAHNAALLVIMAEVCIIYATAGWYKIQGSRWADGSAVYYPLNLDYFTPFPEISEALAGMGLVIMVLSYGTVIAQVAFPFALLNRRLKNVFLVLMIGEHLGIAVLLGLPFFSLAMISMDIVFLPTAFLLWLGHRVSRATARLPRPGRRGRPADPGVPALPEQRAAGEAAREPSGSERPA